jgi:hypothetical protein
MRKKQETTQLTNAYTRAMEKFEAKQDNQMDTKQTTSIQVPPPPKKSTACIIDIDPCRGGRQREILQWPANAPDSDPVVSPAASAHQEQEPNQAEVKSDPDEGEAEYQPPPMTTGVTQEQETNKTEVKVNLCEGRSRSESPPYQPTPPGRTPVSPPHPLEQDPNTMSSDSTGWSGLMKKVELIWMVPHMTTTKRVERREKNARDCIEKPKSMHIYQLKTKFMKRYRSKTLTIENKKSKKSMT